MPAIDLSILNQRQTPAFYADVFANRPAAGFVGRIFVSTNTFAFYRDNGTSWDLIGGPGTGTVTGTGANGQVTFWNGASTITGSNDLFWDATNGHLGVNTNVPGTAIDVHHDQPTVAILNQTVATNDTRIGFQNNGVGLWRIGSFYSGGSNDFKVNDAVLNINRFTIKSSSGQTFVGDEVTSSGLFVVNNSSSDAHIVALGATAPSIRVRNAGTGASLQFGLGLATTTNNFIQGATGGEFCIFNDSLTAQPILFGIKDAGLGNTQEAARISPARNFLIGTTTDTGQKLQVSGQFYLSSAATVVSYINTTNASGASNVYQQSNVNVGWIGNGSSSLIGGSTTDFTINGVNNLNLAVGGFGRLTIASTGAATFSSSVNLGTIANSSDLSLLNIKQSSTAYNNGIYIERGGERNGYFMYIGGAVDSLTFRRNYFGTQSDVMSLTRDGNVGIGTNTPTSLFTLQGNGVSPLVMTINSANPNCDIFMQSSVSANAVRLRNGADDFSVFTNGSQRTTVTSSGNLLIGTTTDNGNKLQVNGNSNFTGTMLVSTPGTGTGVIFRHLAGTNNPGLFISTVEASGKVLAVASGSTGSLDLGLGGGGGETFTLKGEGQARFVPRATDPAAQQAGDVYFNSTSNKLRLYDGTNWVDLN